MYETELDLGRRFLQEHAPPGRLLLCAIAGSHLYGFPSPGSDIDLKGVHQAPTEDLLGLAPPVDSFDRLLSFEGVECDLTTNEVRQALLLLLRGNGNVLERIFSPLQLVETPELEELRNLARASLSRNVYGHYSGFFKGSCREYERNDRTVKRMLYAYRVALTGIHLLSHGEVESNLATLAPRYGFAEVSELIARKTSTREKLALSDAEDLRFRDGWKKLQEQLDRALASSPLPEEPANTRELSAWLISRRFSHR
jgi:hypothetical protein